MVEPCVSQRQGGKVLGNGVLNIECSENDAPIRNIDSKFSVTSGLINLSRQIGWLVFGSDNVGTWAQSGKLFVQADYFAMIQQDSSGKCRLLRPLFASG